MMMDMLLSVYDEHRESTCVSSLKLPNSDEAAAEAVDGELACAADDVDTDIGHKIENLVSAKPFKQQCVLMMKVYKQEEGCGLPCRSLRIFRVVRLGSGPRAVQDYDHGPHAALRGSRHHGVQH